VKAVGVAFIALNAYIATVLAGKLLRADFGECALIFALMLTHPLYLSIAYDGSGIVDPIFQIFINLYLLCLLPLMEEEHSKVGLHLALTQRKRIWLVVTAVISVFCCLTSHERGVTIFFMAGGLYIYYYWEDIRRLKLPRFTAVTILMTICVLMAAFYLWKCYLPRPGGDRGEDYRTLPVWHCIERNLTSSHRVFNPAPRRRQTLCSDTGQRIGATRRARG
jgi:hypothetical protein